MSNTQLRILSAVALLVLVIGALLFGESATLGFIGLASLLIIDEITINFLRIERFSSRYLTAHLVFLAPFIFFNWIEVGPGYFTIFVNSALVMNGMLLFFLFKRRLKLKEMIGLWKRFPEVIGVYVLLPIMCLSFLVTQSQWQGLLIVLLLVNFGMDTGAWFFGRKFGRHKLWPAVSPNKTVEGLIGGVFIAGLLGSVSWWVIFHQLGWLILSGFSLLGVISQGGDLVQSKLKRCFEIKDSSSLIPGHGGVYDRLDSLLYLAPFYAWGITHF